MVRHGWNQKLWGLALLLVIPSLSYAQPGGRGGFGGGGGGFGGRGGMFGPPGLLGMLMQEPVRQELKLTEDQFAELETMGREAGEAMRGSFGNFRDMSEEERQAAFEKMRMERDKLEKQMREKLLGALNQEQAARFSELEFQYFVQQGDLPRALKSAGVELTADKEEALKTKQEEVTKRVNEEIAKLRADGNKEVLSDVVSGAQLEKLMGKPFTFEQRPDGRGRGGPGGPGGGPDGGGRRGGRGDRGRPPAEGDDDAGARRRRDL